MEDFKSIKIELDFADEAGNRTKKVQTIKVNTLSLKDKSTSYTRFHVNSIFTLSFTIQIPDFIHSYLIGKSVPSSRSEKIKDYGEDFLKSIKRDSIESLTEKWCEVIADYVWLKKTEKAELKKVIFYQFSNKHGDYKSYWNGNKLGELAGLDYKYCIGYVSEIEKTKIRYNESKLPVSSSYDKDFYNLKYVEWTQERELFFVNVQKSFKTIIENINKFESCITEETINQLIVNSPLQLTN